MLIYQIPQVRPLCRLRRFRVYRFRLALTCTLVQGREQNGWVLEVWTFPMHLAQFLFDVIHTTELIWIYLECHSLLLLMIVVRTRFLLNVLYWSYLTFGLKSDLSLISGTAQCKEVFVLCGTLRIIELTRVLFLSNPTLPGLLTSSLPRCFVAYFCTICKLLCCSSSSCVCLDNKKLPGR